MRRNDEGGIVLAPDEREGLALTLAAQMLDTTGVEWIGLVEIELADSECGRITLGIETIRRELAARGARLGGARVLEAVR